MSRKRKDAKTIGRFALVRPIRSLIALAVSVLVRLMLNSAFTISVLAVSSVIVMQVLTVT